MKVYESRQLRNLVVAGHGGCGKTTLVAAALYTAGATPRQGRVEDGTTPTDYDDEEIQRRTSIMSALAPAEWATPAGEVKLNLIDTPGQIIFVHEAGLAAPAVEAMLLVVDAAAGVQVQTLKLWELAAARQLPVVIVVGRADHDHADLEGALQAVRERFGRGVCPAQLALGAPGDFTGIVDLVGMQSRSYAGGGGKGKTGPIAAAEAEAAQAGHEALVEMVAEGDDALLQEFFDTGTLPLEHLAPGLRAAIRERRIFPVLYTAGASNLGVDALLDFLADYAPAPGEPPAPAGRNPITEAPLERPVSDAAPLSLYVFKTVADPFAGRLSVFKVRSGRLRSDDTVVNHRRGGQEKLAHLSVLQGKQLLPVPELHAGDLGVVAKLRETLTGDTLGDKSAPIVYPAVAGPEAAIHFAIEAKSRADEDKVGIALHKMLEEDLALHFERDEQTKEFLLGGTGQQHVEIAIAKLKRRYNVEVKLKAPKVPYRETILGRADVQGRHKKQTGGHGQFGDCRIRMEPLKRGAGFEFVNEIFGGAIPRNFIPAVEKGIVESAARGYLAGFPVVDFRVTLYDGSYHDVDSSEMAFKIAGSLAFRKAMETARPVLLEPIMHVEVESPGEFAGDLIGDLNGRRGRIEGMEPRGAVEVIRALAPMSEMLTYQSDLTSKTQGRGSFHMHFSHYDLVPAAAAEKIVAKAKEQGHAAHAAEE